MPPFRFFVYRGVGEGAQRSNSLAVNADARGGDLRSRRFIHKRHELVRKARHGAADANAADVRAAANSGHPSAFWHVAVDHRPPTTQFHDALRRAIHFGKVALLVIPGAVAAVMHRFAEKPRW